MSTQPVTLSTDKRGVATVTLNRADKHNAFDEQLIGDLTTLFRQLGNDNNVRVIVLAAAGKSFCAGADLNWMKRMANYSQQENLADATALATMLRTLNSLSKPTIARVQGAALGGGVGLISCCDIAVACERASFCLSEVKLGLVPATISPYVVNAIGSRAARRYFMTAERFDTHTALRIGLISEHVNEQQLDVKIASIIDSLLGNGPNAIGIAKQLVADIDHHPINDALIHKTSELIANVRSSDEAKEGLNAYLSKRPVNWIKLSS